MEIEKTGLRSVELEFKEGEKDVKIKLLGIDIRPEEDTIVIEYIKFIYLNGHELKESGRKSLYKVVDVEATEEKEADYEASRWDMLMGDAIELGILSRFRKIFIEG